LETRALGLPASDDRVLDLHHGRSTRGKRDYPRAVFAEPVAGGRRWTYFWTSSEGNRVIPSPTWVEQTSTCDRLPPSSRPARRPSSARRIAPSRSMPGRLFPPVLAALKLVREPDGSVSKRWIPPSS